MTGKALTVANAITAFRLVLFGLFVWTIWQDNQLLTVGLFAAIWALDGLDGFAARRLHQETDIGFLFDKVVDRCLIVGGSILLLAAGRIQPAALFLLTKDIGLLPALTIHAQRGERIASVGLLGKLTTFLQGASLIYLLLDGPWPLAVIAVVAVVGALTAVRHLYQLTYAPAI